MKKLILISFLLIMIIAFSACTDNRAEEIINAENAYESMSEALDGGDFEQAKMYYENGAVDSGQEGLVSLYYHLRAMQDYRTKGCIGFPVDLIAEKSDEISDSAQTLLDELRVHTEIFDGVYSLGGLYYVYFSDGKIAVGDGVKLYEENYCSGELVCIEDVYYWANHNDNSVDTLLYKINKTETGISLTAMDEVNNIYAGEYISVSVEMPELMY